MFTAEENRANPPTSHIVLSIPGVRAETVALDAMHAVDLGVACHAVGNLFFELIYDRLLPGSRAEAAAALCAKISALQEDLGVPVSSRLRNFKLENVTDPDAPNQSYPCLRYIKARERRYLASVAVALSREFETESLRSKHRTRNMEALARLCDAIAHGDVFRHEESGSSLEVIVRLSCRTILGWPSPQCSRDSCDGPWFPSSTCQPICQTRRSTLTPGAHGRTLASIWWA